MTIKRNRICTSIAVIAANWNIYKLDSRRIEILKKWGVVEAPYGDIKQNRGLARSKYLELNMQRLQSYFAVVIHNLKVAIERIYNVDFKENNVYHSTYCV